MKIFSILVCSAILMILSCKEEGPACESLRAELLSFDVADVQNELNPWLAELEPVSVQDDPLGHKQNLESFLQRLESDCSLSSTMFCYACIETYPVQSEISLKVDSAGYQVNRILDILTPENNVMTIRDIHL